MPPLSVPCLVRSKAQTMPRHRRIGAFGIHSLDSEGLRALGACSGKESEAWHLAGAGAAAPLIASDIH